MRRFERSWVILATGFAVLFFSGGSRFAFGLMLKPMTDDLGWSRSSVTLAVTTFMFASALAMPVVGRLVDRYSIRWVMAIAAAVAAVGIGLVSRVSAPWHLFALYGLVYAIGQAGTSVGPVSVLITRWFPHRRGLAASSAISGNAIGQLVLIMLLASLLTSLGWRNSFAALGIASFAIVPLVLVTVRSRPAPADAPRGPEGTPPPDGQGASLRGAFASRQLWLLVAIYGVCGFQDFFVATHVVAFAEDQGVGPLLAGNMLALMGLLGLFGVIASGLLADAFGAARPTALCFALRIAIFAGIIYFQSTLGILVFALAYGFTFLITAPLTVVFAGNIFGTARLGAISGVISMVHQVAGGLGAFVGAFIFDQRGSYDGAFVLMLLLSFVALAFTALLRERSAVPAVATS